MSDQQKKQKKAKRNALALNIADKVGQVGRKVVPPIAAAALFVVALVQNTEVYAHEERTQ